MSAITDARAAMAELLRDGTGVQAFAFMPGRIVPPVAIVLPGTPYLTRQGATFGGFTLGLEAVVVADAKVSETGARTLDQLIDDATVALVNAGITVSEVSEPWQLTAQNGAYLASTLTTSQPVSL